MPLEQGICFVEISVGCLILWWQQNGIYHQLSCHGNKTMYYSGQVLELSKFS